MIDIGTNLANKAFRRDLPAVLRRAKDAGVDAIIATGTSEPASRAVWEIAEAHHAEAPRLFCTAGVHPHHARDFDGGTLGALRELAKRPEVVAIGECGLDFDRNFSPPDAQRRAFEAQLALAVDLGMPVFLHERAAHEDFAAILERHRSKLPGAVVHCFTGDARALDRYLALDCHIGITGFICDDRPSRECRRATCTPTDRPGRGSHLIDLVRRIPANRLMIETDAPYILPRTMPRAERPSDGRNEPSLLRWVLAAVAKARGESEDAVGRATVATTRAFFRLPAQGK